MITTMATLLLLAAGPQAGSWGPTTLSPDAVAKRVDDRLATLAKTTVYYTFFHNRSDNHPEGGRAEAGCRGHIVGPGVFWLQVPTVNFKSKFPIDYDVWIADGKRFSEAADNESPRPIPIAKRPAGPVHPARVWFKEFSRVIMSGLGRPTKPLQGFVVDARKEGFKVLSQSRTLTFKAKSRTSYRIIALKGVVRYEINVDGFYNLPTSITNTVGTVDNSGWKLIDWNLKPGKTLLTEAINFRKQPSTRALSPAPRLP